MFRIGSIVRLSSPFKLPFLRLYLCSVEVKVAELERDPTEFVLALDLTLVRWGVESPRMRWGVESPRVRLR